MPPFVTIRADSTRRRARARSASLSPYERAVSNTVIPASHAAAIVSSATSSSRSSSVDMRMQPRPMRNSEASSHPRRGSVRPSGLQSTQCRIRSSLSVNCVAKRLRALTTATWWRAAIVLVPIAAGAVAIAVFSESNPVVVFLLVAAGVAVAGLIGTYFVADSRAKAAFLRAWARSRGWAEGHGIWVDDATPLLRDGDRRESNDHVYGPLTGGGEAALCHYTYEVRKESTDSHGNTTTEWE